MRALILSMTVLAAATVDARPYRSMVTRTASTLREGNVELGLRYQGFFLGTGNPEGTIAIPWHQVAAHLRYGIFDSLEIESQVEVLLEKQPNEDIVTAHLGDIPLGLQWTFLDTRVFALGVYGRVTFPTGPSDVDVLPPTVSDGTWDGEATLIAELRFSRDVRLMLNGGYLWYGTRARGDQPDFDVPNAIRYDAALTVNLGRSFLIGAEVVGRSFLEPVITPVWGDQQHLIEAGPVLRIETIPQLVIEAALGIAVTRELQEIYWVRPLLGLTYEF